MTDTICYIAALLIFAVSLFYLFGMNAAMWGTVALWVGSIVLCLTAKGIASRQ